MELFDVYCVHARYEKNKELTHSKIDDIIERTKFELICKYHKIIEPGTFSKFYQIKLNKKVKWSIYFAVPQNYEFDTPLEALNCDLYQTLKPSPDYFNISKVKSEIVKDAVQDNSCKDWENEIKLPAANSYGKKLRNIKIMLTGIGINEIIVLSYLTYLTKFK